MKLTPTLGGSYSGSLGGLTASHNTGGQYLRRRSIPTNPNTLRQQTVRSLIGGLVNAWNSALTDPQRQAWRDYAQNTPVTDTLGQTITLSGINMFVRSNVTRMQLAAAAGGMPAPERIDAAPTVFDTGQGVVTVTQFAGDFTSPPGTVTFTVELASGAPVAGVLLIFVAPPQTAGTRYYAGPYQLACGIDVTSGFTGIQDSCDLSTDWFSDTVPIAGWDTLNIPLRMIVAYEDGRVSEEWRGFVPFEDATP